MIARRAADLPPHTEADRLLDLHVVLTRKHPRARWERVASYPTAEQAARARTLLARSNAQKAIDLAMHGYANPTSRRGRKALVSAHTIQAREYTISHPTPDLPTQADLILAA